MRALTLLAVSWSALLAGCEGSLTVTGFVPEADCEIGLWTMDGPIWQQKERTLRRKATVSRTFEIEWSVSGPHSPHWLEMTCPQGETFRSHEFLAGRAGDRVELGRVRLRPPSTLPDSPDPP